MLARGFFYGLHRQQVSSSFVIFTFVYILSSFSHSQLIGSALAAMSLTPQGNVSGPGTEEALARAAYQLERGNLVLTLRELDGVKGYGQVLMQDWKSLAKERLIVDQAMVALKSNAMLRHKAFVPK
jgi:hypothetical protein